MRHNFPVKNLAVSSHRCLLLKFIINSSIKLVLMTRYFYIYFL